MGKTYKTEVSFDIRDLGKMLTGKVKCKRCGGKMKISKDKVYEGHGSTRMNGYVDNIEGSPVHFKMGKQVFINQDIYEVKYFYKCCDCGEICPLDEI